MRRRARVATTSATLRLTSALLVLGCNPRGADEGDGETTGSDVEAPALLPELTPAIDLDPDPTIVEVELRVREVEVELLPGALTRALAYVDGAAPTAPARHPGPLVVAERGQTVRIRLVNELPQAATTLHLHGVRLAAAHDGNPVVEGGLFPGEARTYEFVAGDPGLYWYHPHLNTPQQMTQGLKGPLLVREPDDPELDADRVIFIDAIRIAADGTTIPEHDDGEMPQLTARRTKSRNAASARVASRAPGAMASSTAAALLFTSSASSAPTKRAVRASADRPRRVRLPDSTSSSKLT